MDKMRKILAWRPWTQPQTSPEAVGTPQPQQQANNDIGTVNVHYTGTGVVNVGGNVGNYGNEEKEGAQTQNSTIGDNSSSNTLNQAGSITVNGAGNTVNVNSQGQGSSSLKQPRSVDVDDLDCTRLKTYYKHTLCEALPLPWYPEHAWNIREVYTELALNDSVEHKFGVEELFKQCPERFPEGVSYRILIEGDAGYGKSTLMLKIASDWSNRGSNDKTNYTSRFSLLLVVKLGYVGEDGNLLSYMESIYKKKIMKMDTPLEDVLESEGAEKVLILLDGYDEANANTKKEVDRIMTKEAMMACHVVLTSRFRHVPDYVCKNALRVTVKGFGPRQVTEAVGKFFIKAGHLTKANVISCLDELLPQHAWGWLGKSDDLPTIDFKNVIEPKKQLPEEKRLGLDQFKKFMKKVQHESPYEELAQCPLLCVMLCCLVSECPNSELPSTCSGLYFAMINRNLYRAARKKAEAAGEDEEQWKWDELVSRIHEDHESYLQDFGRLCINGLETGSMSFSLFEITGNEKTAKTTDVKVTRLIEAGVLVQDFTESNTNADIRYQVPHRTTAEFLAAYYLSRETDPEKPTNSWQQNLLLDLFRLDASFDEVAVSLIEMGKPKCLANAFSVIKFPSDCLTENQFMKSYFTQHGAAGTLSEFKDALPEKLEVYIGYDDVTVSPSGLQLIEEFGQMDAGNENAFRSLQPKDCPVSLHIIATSNIPIYLDKSVKSGAVLNRLKFFFESGGIREGDQMRQKVVRSFQELLKSGSCPVQLSFKDPSTELILAVTEAMQEVPEACRLRIFELFPNLYDPADSSPLSEVLAEKWLSNLQHLGIGNVGFIEDSPRDTQWGGILNPILKGLGEPGCSLTSLHLTSCVRKFRFVDSCSVLEGPLLEDLVMLATKLVTLRLEGMELYFDVTKISEYAVKEKCSLKSLHLKYVKLRFEGLLPSADENKDLGWGNVALQLEALTIDICDFPVEFLSWLNLSVPNLRTLSIDSVEKWTPNDDTDSDATDSDDTDSDDTDSDDTDSDDTDPYATDFLDSDDTDNNATKLLEALTGSSGDRSSRAVEIEDLSLLEGFWRTYKGRTLDPIKEALQRCPGMKKVKLEFGKSLPESIDPGPSTPSSSDVKASKSDNVHLALLRIVLSVPKLQSLTLTSKDSDIYKYYNDIRTFHAIADEAKKWPGKISDNECKTLTLHGLSNKNACQAMHVFRERKLKYDLEYVSDKVYKLWFPV